MTDAIEFRGLTKYYGRRRGIVDLTAETREGEVLGFLGPNGAGKTTVIRLLLGFVRPTSGEARVFGRDSWAESALVRRSLAYLSGEPGYLGELTAAETLEFMCRTRHLPPDAWRALADRIDLDYTVPIRKLSRGNRQKVGIAQVFMGNEPLLVMDEPTVGLDPLMQREFLHLVAEARSAGRTVFLSSHNLSEVERACDRAAIVREGRLVEIRPVRELLGDHWRSVSLVLGAQAPDGAFDLPGVQLISKAGDEIQLMVQGDIRGILERLISLEIRDVTISTPDIEEVFLGYYASSRQADHPDRDTGGPPQADATAARRIGVGPEARQ
jgi:ABC-2 type transport system ATP-binding protein